MFCTIPLWRLSRPGRTSFYRRTIYRVGVVADVVVAAVFLTVCVANTQLLPSLVFFSVTGIELDAPVRIAGFRLQTDLPARHELQHVFNARCSLLASCCVITLFAFGIAAWSTGVRRRWTMFVGAVGIVGSILILGYVYTGGASELSSTWGESIVCPTPQSFFAILAISVIGGGIVASVVCRKKSGMDVSLDVQKLGVFTPWRSVMISVLMLLVVQLFSSFLSSRAVLGPRNMFAELFQPIKPGPIHEGLYGVTEGSFSLVWGTLISLVMLSNLSIRYWNKRKMNKFDATATSISIKGFCYTCLISSVTIVVAALGFGWFGFSTLVLGGDTPFSSLYENLAWLFWDARFVGLMTNALCVITLGIVVLCQLFRRLKVAVATDAK